MKSEVRKGERFRLEVTFSWTLLITCYGSADLGTNRGYLVPLMVPRGDPLQRAGPGKQRHGLSSLRSLACKRVRTSIYALLSIGERLLHARKQPSTLHPILARLFHAQLIHLLPIISKNKLHSTYCPQLQRHSH